MEEDCRCWRPADWSHLPLDELSKKLSEYCRWWCTAVAPDLCTCLPIVLISLSLRNKTQEKSPQLQQPPPNPLPPATGIAAPARRRPAIPDRKELAKPSPSRESAGFREREREGEGARERYGELNAVKDLFHMEGAVPLVVALSPLAFSGSNEAATIGVNSERK